MPELPEVETVKNGLTPLITNKVVSSIDIRQPKLRWPISSELPTLLHQQPILTIKRRSKYLIFAFPQGHLLIHLGMSGTLRYFTLPQVVNKHDHVDIQFTDHSLLRYNDPRRFGAIVWTDQTLHDHPLLCALGPEPLTHDFNTHYFTKLLKHRQCPIKQSVMNAKMVVGVGNIYANEALFKAKIFPGRPSNSLTKSEIDLLVRAIKAILRQAIKQGGTTLKDFKDSQGKPGYFRMKLAVYDRTGDPCIHCKTPIQKTVIQQRSTFWCPICQA